MDKSSHKIPYTEKLQQIKLADSARLRISQNLDKFADFHAISESERLPETDRLNEVVSRTSVWNTALFIRINRSTMPAFALIAMVLVGGGTSLAAQGSLPNDLLYPVKINFNENVRSAFAFSEKAEATLQAELLTERVEEAVTLQANGQLDGDLAARVRTKVAAQADAANQANARLDESIKVESDNRIHLALERFNSLLDDATLLAVETEVQTEVITDVRRDKGAVETGTASRNQGMATRQATLDTARRSNEESGTMSISASTAIETMMAFEPVEISTLVTDTNKRIEALQKLLVNYQDEIQSDLYSDYLTSLNEAAQLMTQVEDQTDDEARQTIAEASDLAGQVESGLSLLGTVSIDPETGVIVKIDFDIAPPIKPEVPETDIDTDHVTQPIDRLESSVESTVDTVVDTATGILDFGESNSDETNTSARGILDISL